MAARGSRSGASEREYARNSMGWSPDTPDSTMDMFLAMSQAFGGGFTPPDRGPDHR